MRKLIFILVVSVLTLSGVAVINAQQTSRDDLERRRAALLNDIASTKALLAEIKKDKNVSMSQLTALQSQLRSRQRLIDNINQEVVQINNNVVASNNEIKILNKNLEVLRLRYAQSVRYAYKNQNAQSMLAFLFSANNFNEAMARFQYMKKSRDFRKNQAGKISTTQNSIKGHINTLNKEKTKKNSLISVEEEQRQGLLEESKVANEMVTELRGKEKDLNAHIAKSQAAAKELDNAIKAAIRREVEIARQKALEEAKKRAEAEAIARAKAEAEARAKAEAEARAKAEAEALRLKNEEIARQKAAEEKRLAEQEAHRKAELARWEEENRRRAAEENKKLQEAQERERLAKNESERKKAQEDAARAKAAASKISNTPYVPPPPSKPSNNNSNIASNKPEIKPTPPPTKPVNVDPVPASKPPVVTTTEPTYKMSLTPDVQTISNNFASNRGSLPWPVESGYIAVPFGRYQHPLEPKVTMENSGIDIASNGGSSVRAVFEGTVSRVVSIAGSFTVIVNHGEYFTVYSYLSNVSVKQGDRVRFKQNIGTVGKNDDGLFVLHFEICRVSGTSSISNENPSAWIAR